MEPHSNNSITRLRQALATFDALPRWQKGAYFFSLLPLTIGTLIFFIWLVNRWEWLPAAGQFTILAGLVSLFVAHCCLQIHNDLQWDDTPEKALRIRKKTIRIRGIMLSNFAFAFIYTFSAIQFGQNYRVIIVNNTSETLESVSLDSPGNPLTLGSVSPGAKTVQTFNRFRYPKYTFSAKLGHKQFSGKLVGDCGRCDIIRINNDGTCDIIDRSGKW